MRIEHALELAGLGLRVFCLHYPMLKNGSAQCSCGDHDCGCVGKHPIASGWQDAATSDPAVIRREWTTHPQANIGVACGGEIDVLDVDAHSGGLVSLAGLEAQHSTMPETWRVRTGSGGLHVYFKRCGRLRNAVKFAPGLDVRTTGGLVVGVGSVHETGRTYEWEPERSPADCELADIPEWLVEEIVSCQPAATSTSHSSQAATANPTAPQEPYCDPRYWLDHYLSQAQPGNRNECGFKLAQQLLDNVYQFDPTREVELVGTMTEFVQRCPQAGQPYTTREAERSFYSALNERRLRGFREPAGPGEQIAGFVHSAKTTFPLTDLGNAERLVDAHGSRLRFDVDSGKWLVWNGKFWQQDRVGEVERLAREVVRSMYDLLKSEPDQSRRAELFKHVVKSESAPRLSAMVDLARNCSGVPVQSEDLDSDTWLLNCSNGVIDLRSGELRPHRAEDLITRVVALDYEPEAECPMWEGFLDRVFGGDAELVRFVQRAIGYSLCGDTREQCFFLLHGAGSNGKSTLLTAVREILADYHRKTGTETLLEKDANSSGNDIARLRGARVVTAIEAKPGRRLAEALVKELTGGDLVSARFLYKEFFEFKPEFKLWLACNHLPHIDGQDYAIWRRIRLIPFRVQFQDSDSPVGPYKDGLLAEKLRLEYPGVLAWMVRGCQSWQAGGLGTARAVRQATSKYRDDMDVLGEFLDERCVLDVEARVKSSHLYAAYSDWARDRGERFPLSNRSFSQRLEERGDLRKQKSGGCYWWTGLGLVEPGESTPADEPAVDHVDLVDPFPKSPPMKEQPGDFCRNDSPRSTRSTTDADSSEDGEAF